MATLNDTDGFTLHGWMVTELHLTGADLIAFALVHQFAQSGAGIYKGNTQYLAAWTGWSENTCRAHLVNLVKKGLIQEVRGRENNSPFCYYKLAADFYEKHPSKFAGSPLKNCGDHPEKNGKSTPQKLRGEYTYNESNKGNNNIYTDRDFLAGLIALGVNPETADAWMVVRHKAKAVSTRVAFDGIAREVAKSGLSAEDCIRTAVERSWRGFKAEWLRRDTPQPQTPSPRQESLVEHNRRVLEEVLNGIKRSNN